MFYALLMQNVITVNTVRYRPNLPDLLPRLLGELPVNSGQRSASGLASARENHLVQDHALPRMTCSQGLTDTGVPPTQGNLKGPFGSRALCGDGRGCGWACIPAQLPSAYFHFLPHPLSQPRELLKVTPHTELHRSICPWGTQPVTASN